MFEERKKDFIEDSSWIHRFYQLILSTQPMYPFSTILKTNCRMIERDVVLFDISELLGEQIDHRQMKLYFIRLTGHFVRLITIFDDIFVQTEY